MFCLDSRNTGYTTASGPTDNSLKWKFQTGNEIVSSPAVADGTVYIGSGDGYVYAIG